MTTTPPANNNTAESDNSKFFVGVGVGILVLTILLVAGAILLAIFAKQASDAVEIIRDMMIVTMALELIIIGTALTVLIVQIARFVNLVNNEVQPIIEATTDTVNTVRGTAVFISKNISEPLVAASAVIRTAQKTLRDVDAIRKVSGIAFGAAAANPHLQPDENQPDPPSPVSRDEQSDFDERIVF